MTDYWSIADVPQPEHLSVGGVVLHSLAGIDIAITIAEFFHHCVRIHCVTICCKGKHP